MTFTHSTPIILPKLKQRQDLNGKRWYTTPDGIEYPSVTTMLGHKEKPWLKEWKTMLGNDKAKKEQQRTADRGASIHKLIEHYLQNDPYPDFMKGYKPEHVAGFNQLKLRLNNIDNIRTQEVQLYSDQLKLAGTVDCIAEYEKVLSVIDFKTSNNNKTKEMIEDYFLQCTAYAIMWHERTGEPVENITVLMSVERGLVPLVFKESIDKYVKPLLLRIHDYYRETNK